MKEKKWTLMQKNGKLNKNDKSNMTFGIIGDKTKFGLVKEHFSFGFESLGLRLREEEKI